MTAGKTWAATGATAAMLAGGLLMGTPVVGATAETAPVAVNPGLNMQTAAADPEQRPGAGLVGGLVAAGIATSTAVALRARRRSRS